MSNTVPIFKPNERFQVMDTPTAEKLRLANKRGRILSHWYGTRYNVQLDGEKSPRVIDASLLVHITAEDEARWAANAQTRAAAKEGEAKP